MIVYINQLLECALFVIFASALLNKKIYFNHRLLSFSLAILGQALYKLIPTNYQSEYILFLITAFAFILAMYITLNTTIKDCVFSFFLTYIITFMIFQSYKKTDDLNISLHH